MIQSPHDFDVRTETPEVPRPVPTAPPPNVHNALAEHTSPSQAQHRNAHSPLDKNDLGLAQGSRQQTLLRQMFRLYICKVSEPYKVWRSLMVSTCPSRTVMAVQTPVLPFVFKRHQLEPLPHGHGPLCSDVFSWFHSAHHAASVRLFCAPPTYHESRRRPRHRPSPCG